MDILNNYTSNCLIEGRSGTGKTSLIVDKYIKAIREKGYSASDILVLTSNSKYAQRLQETILSKLHQSFDEDWIVSFNTFLLKIFREYSFEAGYKYDCKQVSKYESLLIIKELIKQELPALSTEFSAHYNKNSFIKNILEIFQWIKSNRLDINEVRDVIASKHSDHAYLVSLELLFTKYQDFLAKHNYIDPNDLINITYNLIVSNEKIKSKIKSRFKMILIDHYEDIEFSSARIINSIFKDSSALINIFYDQYQIVNGSKQDRFHEICSEAKRVFKCQEVLLESSYRNSHEMFDIAKQIVIPDDTPDLSKFNVYSCADVTAEIDYVVSKINYLSSHVDDFDYDEVAIVSNSIYQAASDLESVLGKAGIPYRLLDQANYIHQRSVVLFLSLISFILKGNERTFKQILPLFVSDGGIDVRDYISFEHRTGINILGDILRGNDAPGLSSEDALLIEKLKQFYFGIRRLRFQSKKDVSLYEWVCRVYQEYIAEYLRVREDAIQIDAVKTFLSMINTNSSIALLFDVQIDIDEFFSDIEQISELFTDVTSFVSDINDYGINISGMNQIKDKEFRYVFIMNMCESVYPRFINKNVSPIDPIALLYQDFVDKGYTGLESPFIDNDRVVQCERNKLYLSLAKAGEDVYLTYPRQFADKDESISSIVADIVRADKVSDSSVDSRTTYSSHSRLEVELEKYYGLLSEKLKKQLGKYEKILKVDKYKSTACVNDLPVAVSNQKRFSATAINTYLSCPKKFFFNKILYLNPPVKDIMHVGNEVHKILEILHRIYPSIAAVGQDVIRKTADRLIERIWYGCELESEISQKRKDQLLKKGAVNNYVSRAVQNFYYNQMVDMVLRYIKQEPLQNLRKRTKYIEKRLSFSINGINLYGIIDRVDIDEEGNYHVIDYKTSRSDSAFTAKTEKRKYLNVEDKQDYKPKNFQMPIYYLACKEALGIIPNSIQYYYLNQPDAKGFFKKMKIAFEGEEKGPLAVIDEDDLDRIITNLSDTVEGIRNGLFPAEPADKMACQNCDYRIVCKEAL